MLKSIDPKQTFEFNPAGLTDTVFTFHAMSGARISTSMGADALFDCMIDTCVISVSNIEVSVYKRDDQGNPIKEDEGYVYENVQFELFEPKKYPEVKLSQVLPTTICNTLGSLIWEISKITKVELGE